MGIRHSHTSINAFIRACIFSYRCRYICLYILSYGVHTTWCVFVRIASCVLHESKVGMACFVNTNIGTKTPNRHKTNLFCVYKHIPILRYVRHINPYEGMYVCMYVCMYACMYATTSACRAKPPLSCSTPHAHVPHITHLRALHKSTHKALSPWLSASAAPRPTARTDT